ncbi:TIGR00730 family Rossman fold protein [Lachnospiraceae bacterium OttesenSCG-928-E19]|nr:TIGR00730 family Rossman fold protein [Lachnospiraceae bacterium OttesenSCG-928-E19]
MIKSVAVYCGHQFGKDPAYARDAARFGELLARNKIKMVFGAGDVGLMGTVATAVVKNGGDIVGVTTPHVVSLQEPAHEDVPVEIVEGINVRKQRMYDLSDAFCILPGGIGTLNELTDVMTMQQVGESKKPIFFLNSGKFWNIFGRVLVHMDHAGFIADMKEYNIRVAETPEELIELIRNHKNLVADSTATDQFKM